jgi:hypothetical protein
MNKKVSRALGSIILLIALGMMGTGAFFLSRSDKSQDKGWTATNMEDFNKYQNEYNKFMGIGLGLLMPSFPILGLAIWVFTLGK